MSEPFTVIAADPPWQFNDRLNRHRGAASQYQTMSIHELKAFELPAIAEDAVLFMWRVAAMQTEALDLMRAWGFTPKSEIVWIKLASQKHRGQLTLYGDANPWVNRRRRMGMGRIVRHTHEVCLIGTRGRPKRLNGGTRSTFSACVGRHSEKPPEFFGIVERLYAGPYVELFSRKQREGWVCLGNEVESIGA